MERTWLRVTRGAVLVVAGLFLYGGEFYNALLLVLSPTNSAPISTLADLLLGIYALGLTRAWQLLGGRSHGLSEWLSPLHDTENGGPGSAADRSQSARTERNHPSK